MSDDLPTASRVKLLSDGTFRIDGGMLVYGVPRFYGRIFKAELKPLYIEAGDERILVDTGIGDLPEKMIDIYGVEKKVDLLSSLKAIGMAPEDITMVINTHLHFDHTGYNKIFTNAMFISQEVEIRYSASPDRFQKGGYFQPNIKDQNFTAVRGEREVAPGVTVIPTPGHTPGHQSVSVELPDEVVIYTGDVAPLRINHEKMYIVGILHDPVSALRSLELLDRMSGWWPEKRKRFIYSHDGEG
ncbi:MAG: N-acyl homoserine lactonase family protein [Candidatus Thermoplasmatota archaeon]|nr:N-acyl homoserine lactonase family protein [Candidatus Thermoplasmatota archaeon]